MLWTGFGLASVIGVLNGLHFLYPVVPSLGGKLYDFCALCTQRPWNAIGWTLVAVRPFAVGLAFLIPLDFSLSCWFFRLF